MRRRGGRVRAAAERSRRRRSTRSTPTTCCATPSGPVIAQHYVDVKRFEWTTYLDDRVCRRRRPRCPTGNGGRTSDVCSAAVRRSSPARAATAASRHAASSRRSSRTPTSRIVEGWSAIADAVRPARGSAAGDLRRVRHLDTCSRHWVSRTSDGVDTTREDYLAHLAGTVIEEDRARGRPQRRAARSRRSACPTREAIERFPRTWYGWPLRSSDDDASPARARPAPPGPSRSDSGGDLVTLPVPSRRPDRAVGFTPERFAALFDAIDANISIAGVCIRSPTSKSTSCWTRRATPSIAATLAGPDPEEAIPRERWGVGHFIGVGAFWRGQDSRRWMLLLDTYKARGFDGYVPMPAESVRRAVVREDGRDGRPAAGASARGARRCPAQLSNDLGLDIRMWGNGSLEPEGWDLGARPLPAVVGVAYGARTHNLRSHNPMLCRLS